MLAPVASFPKEVNPRLDNRPLQTNGRSAILELTSLVKEVTGGPTKPISYVRHLSPGFNLIKALFIYCIFGRCRHFILAIPDKGIRSQVVLRCVQDPMQ